MVSVSISFIWVYFLVSLVSSSQLVVQSTLEAEAKLGASPLAVLQGSPDKNGCFPANAGGDWSWMLQLKEKRLIGVFTIIVGEGTGGFSVFVSETNSPRAGIVCFNQETPLLVKQEYEFNCMEEGRYIFVRLHPTTGVSVPSSLCKLEVFEAENVALHKQTKQSSIDFQGVGARVVDGIFKTDYADLSCMHTLKEKGPWLQVDLGEVMAVYGVRVTNRSDCCSDRTKLFQIRIGESEDRTQQMMCHKVDAPLGAGETRMLPCHNPLRGRYVSLIKTDNDILQFCEFEVFRAAKPVQLTTTYGDWEPWTGSCVDLPCQQTRQRSVSGQCTNVTRSDMLEQKACPPECFLKNKIVDKNQTPGQDQAGKTPNVDLAGGKGKTDNEKPAEEAKGWPVWYFVVAGVGVIVVLGVLFLLYRRHEKSQNKDMGYLPVQPYNPAM